MRQEFCEILKRNTGHTVNPNNILEIHRIPKNPAVRGPRHVILKFINTESRVAVIKNRAELETFTMMDHLTPLNMNLIRRLIDHPKIDKAWHFNTRVFAFDKQGTRRKFDICDNIDHKLRELSVMD